MIDHAPDPLEEAQNIFLAAARLAKIFLGENYDPVIFWAGSAPACGNPSNWSCYTNEQLLLVDIALGVTKIIILERLQNFLNYTLQFSMRNIAKVTRVLIF